MTGEDGREAASESTHPLIQLLTLSQINRAPHVALQARIEQSAGVRKRRTLGKRHLHHAFISLARADHAAMNPNRNPAPLPVLDHRGKRLPDQSTHMPQRLTPPIAQFPDPCVDQRRRGFAPGRPPSLPLALDAFARATARAIAVDPS